MNKWVYVYNIMSIEACDMYIFTYTYIHTYIHTHIQKHIHTKLVNTKCSSTILNIWKIKPCNGTNKLHFSFL